MKSGFNIYPFTCPGLADRDLLDRVVEAAVTAERAGFECLWLSDHVQAQYAETDDPTAPDVDAADLTEPFLEAYTLLGGLAASTERIRLGALVSPVAFRHPALLAKIVTTLDVMSKGRAILGLGSGWNEPEHRGYGLPFPPVAERMDRLSETVQICRAMFDNGVSSFEGTYYSVPTAANYPRPIQERIPIIVAGNGEKRTLRIVAQYADACNVTGSAAFIRRKLDVLARHCAEVGTDVTRIAKTTLKVIVVRDTAAEAARAAAEARVAMHMEQQEFDDYAIVGDAEQAHEQVMSFLAVGLDGIQVTLANPFAFSLEEIAAAGEVLTRATAVEHA